MLFDPDILRIDGQSGSMLVNFLDFLSSIFGAFYFLLNARNVKEIPIFLLIWLINLHLFFMNGLLGKLIVSSDLSIFSLDPALGCLGFLSLAEPASAFILYGVFGSLLGSAGYVLSLLFFSPLVCSNAFLLEPFFAQVLGCLLSIDRYPGALTVLGGLAVFIGVFEIE
jgi:drug/metabolite transporter (DMT)-like permease